MAAEKSPTTKTAIDETVALKVTRTKYRPPKLSSIPEELKLAERWVNWKLVPRQGEPGQFQKRPINPLTGAPAYCNDPGTWDSFDEAVQRFKHGNVNGIGFQLGKPFVGIDIDNCRDPRAKKTEDWALNIVEEMDTYTEVSPSGTGLHLILKGHLPAGQHIFKNRHSKVEIYASGRYFTVTGRHIRISPSKVEERDAQLQKLIKRLGETLTSKKESVPRNGVGANTADDKFVATIMAMEDKSPLKALWSGDKSDYSSASEADQALCTTLALRLGCDVKRIDSLFRQSPLFRRKWDEVHSADGRTMVS